MPYLHIPLNFQVGTRNILLTLIVDSQLVCFLCSRIIVLQDDDMTCELNMAGTMMREWVAKSGIQYVYM